jgi:hypothetical protein
MGKHSLPRRPLSRVRTAAIVALVPVAGILTAALVASASAAVEGQAHAAIPATEHDAAGVIEACWLEPKPSDLAERVCGSVNLAPADAYGFRSMAEQRLAYAVETSPERHAAQLIADRLDSGQELFEDWTWAGMPPVVGAFNDALLDQWEAAGRPDPSGWLESYAATVEA